MIPVTFDTGAYGPTIQIVLTTREHGVFVRELFLRMRQSSEVAEYRLHEDHHFLVHGLAGFVWWNLPEPRRVALTMTPLLIAEWRLTSDGWEHCAGLMQGLLDAGSGHQYLGLIRFRGHLPKGGYDVHDGDDGKPPAIAEPIRPRPTSPTFCKCEV